MVDYRLGLNGEVEHIHIIWHPILNDAGEIIEIVGTTMDVTGHKRAEDRLRRSEGYLAETQKLTRQAVRPGIP